MEREKSSEESDVLERSTKKFKDNHCEGEYQSRNSDSNANAVRSYKDKLVGIFLGRTNKHLVLMLSWRMK